MKSFFEFSVMLAVVIVGITNLAAALAVGDDGLTRVTTKHGMVVTNGTNGTVLMQGGVSLAKHLFATSCPRCLYHRFVSGDCPQQRKTTNRKRSTNRRSISTAIPAGWALPGRPQTHKATSTTSGPAGSATTTIPTTASGFPASGTVASSSAS